MTGAAQALAADVSHIKRAKSGQADVSNRQEGVVDFHSSAGKEWLTHRAQDALLHHKDIQTAVKLRPKCGRMGLE